MKIVILGQHAAYAPLLKSFLQGEEYDVQGLTGLLEDLDTDVLITSRISADEMRRVRTRLLHVPGIGLDAIPFPALPEHCVVCNVGMHEIPIGEYVTHAVLDYAIFPGGSAFSFEADQWLSTYVGRPFHHEVFGQTAVVVGFGNIGQAVSKRLRALGMYVIAIDPHPEKAKEADEVLAVDELDSALPRADAIILALPLKDSTVRLIGERQFARMKNTALLVNVSRAQLIDEDALYEALKARRIGRAVLDVWYGYPSPANPTLGPAKYPFWSLDNVRATPHISGWSSGLIHRRYEFIARNVQRLRRGEPLLNVVKR